MAIIKWPNQVDYLTAYNAGMDDARSELRAELKQINTSLQCTIAWLKNGNNVSEAIRELELQAEKLRKLK